MAWSYVTGGSVWMLGEAPESIGHGTKLAEFKSHMDSVFRQRSDV